MILPGAIGSVQVDEAERLRDLATGLFVLEVGSYVGRSTVAMARTATRVYAVDWHRGGHPDYEYPDSLAVFIQNLETYGVRDRVVPLIGRAEEILPALRPGWFGFAFLDAGHDYESTRWQLGAIDGLVGPGALVACHDYLDLWNKGFGVGRAVDDFCRDAGWAIRETCISTAILERTA